MLMKALINSRDKWLKTAVLTTQLPKMKKRMKTTTQTKMASSGGKTTTVIGGTESQDRTIGNLTIEGATILNRDLLRYL